MILYDNACTPCVRKKEWRELRNFAREHKLPLTRIDIKKQPQYKRDMWWGADAMPLPVVVYKDAGERVAINLSEFIRLNIKEQS